jgi:hypothetical protein
MVLDVVEAPTEGLSRVVRNTRIANTFTDWTNNVAECEIIPDGDENKKLPCREAKFDYPLNFFQFHSTGPKPIEVVVVVRR